MATYFHGSHDQIHPENIPTLYLMNPNFAGYSDASASASMMLQPQHLVGIPVQTAIPRSAQQGLRLSLPLPEIATRVPVRNEASLISSKYLRFAQQLLDEIVSVDKGIRGGLMKEEDHDRLTKASAGGDRVDETDKQPVELTTAERQELLMKKAKLVNMLDEVGQRYRQYRQQMNLVVSFFEAAAGIGSAKTYTALALQTISKQFRCLRDAITTQIRAAAKNLGEEQMTGDGGIQSKGCRLQFIGQQVRQQRALQQLGMIQNSAWRPQRGLPERAVSVLRAWLFEHFLHPYPKDSDKQLLAKQAGLTRSQVSNWFINARVRLWKPMIEEMYKEEMKDDEEQSNGDHEKASETNVNDDSNSKSNAYQDSSPTRTDQTYTQPPSLLVPPSLINVHNQASYVEDDDDLFLQSKLKKARSEESMSREGDNHGFSDYGGGFGGYSVGDIERFGLEQFAPGLSTNGVSLTLGLTQYGNFPPLPGSQASYLSSDSIEDNGFSSLDHNASVAHPSNAYENMSMESRKRFVAQLLPDFVA